MSELIPKTDGKVANTWHFLRDAVFRALLLFFILNLTFAGLKVQGSLSHLSAYNWLFPGRVRFPFGENQKKAYNLSIYDVNAMFASHLISGGNKPEHEYRIVIIGDSSVWGILLRPEETLTGQLNVLQLTTCNGQAVRFYNLGYPTLDLTKDLMILTEAMRFKPDLVIWLVTLEAFPNQIQLSSPIVANNPQLVVPLIQKYHLNLDSGSKSFVYPSFLDQTIVGERRPLADLLRLQLYGVLWAATGIDQVYLQPGEYTPAQKDFDNDQSFQDLHPPKLDENGLAFDVLNAGIKMVGQVPILIINEPILISSGKNSDIRYNFFYPRWAYDQHRQLMSEHASQNQWAYYDYWNIIPENEFTNSAIHLTPAGSSILAGKVREAIQSRICLNN